MPNWCSVDLEIKGSKKQIKKIEKLLKGEIKSSQFNAHNISSKVYSYLNIIDKVNITLKMDKKLYRYYDKNFEPFEATIYDRNIYINNIEDLLYIMYEIVDEKTVGYISNLDLLTITGTKETIYYMINFLKNFNEIISNKKSHKDEYDFSRVMPDNPLCFYRDFKDMTLVNSNHIPNIHVKDWYYSRISRMSTKWFPNLYRCINNGDTLYLIMECAWSPCDNICMYLTEIFDITIEMKYSEPGMGFAGRVYYEDGECIEDEQYNSRDILDYTIYCTKLYDYDRSEAIDYIGEEISWIMELDDIFDLQKMNRKQIRSKLKENSLCNYKNEKDLDDNIDYILDLLKPMKKVKIKKIKK